MNERRRGPAVLAAVLTGFGLIALAARESAYLWLLFLGVPFLTGFVAVLIYSWGQRRPFGKCMWIAMLPFPLICGLVVAWRVDGLICCLMAAPIALPLGLLGGSIAWALQSHEAAVLGACLILTIPPSFVFGHHGPSPRMFSATTSIIVNAPPEIVWRYVAEFPPIAAPPGPLFRAGVAYPLESGIEGTGVGSARRCVLSTGTMAETVIAWNPPYLLRFRVNSTPPAMHELSPWGDIEPAHLRGFYEARQGQFQLTELPGHRTLVEGQSWYSHGLEPAQYWRLWSDYVVHQVHRRVLEHIKLLAERDGAESRYRGSRGKTTSGNTTSQRLAE